jgi:hypothetical protein
MVLSIIFIALVVAVIIVENEVSDLETSSTAEIMSPGVKDKRKLHAVVQHRQSLLLLASS